MSSAIVERSPFPVIPDQPPVPPAARPRLLLIATSLVSVAVAVGFGGLLATYVGARQDHRASGAQWLPQGVDIPLTQPNMMAFTLVFSAVCMYWAYWSMRNGDRQNTSIALAMSVLLGLAPVAQTAFLLTIMDMPLAGDDFGRPPLFYAVIGTHLVIMLAAILFAVVVWIRTLGGNYSARDVEGLLGVTVFWYVAVALYLVLWYAIYITK